MFHGSGCINLEDESRNTLTVESPGLNNFSLLRITVGFARTVRAFILSTLGNNGSGLTGAELHRGEGPETGKSWWRGLSFLTSFCNEKA